MNAGLDFQKTWNFLIDAAREKRLVTYGGIAKANSAPWHSVRLLMPRHLRQINEESISSKKVMLGALVVNAAGEVADGARKSIIDHARDAGLFKGAGLADESAFILQQRKACFAQEWTTR